MAPESVRWPYVEPADRPAVEGSGHLHWTLTAFHHIDENGTLWDSVVVDVEATTEEEAVARAMAVIVRPFYRVAAVREACSTDPELRRARE